MAVGRLSVSAGRKGMASPHAMYIAREGKYAKPDDDLEKLEFVGVGNMPEWAKDKPNFFWKMSDEHERANGTAYREHVISLPRELSAEQRHDLILDWIAQEIGDRHAYQYAIHNPPAADGMEQPHCHLMYCEREIDGIDRAPDQYFKRWNKYNPEKGGARKANTGLPPAERKQALKDQRTRWEDTCNRHLEQANSNARINMKSYKDAGRDYKSLNYDMRDLVNPAVRATQDAATRAKTAYIDALDERKTINIREEIERLNQIAEQAQQPDNNPFATAGEAAAWMDAQELPPPIFNTPAPKPTPKAAPIPEPEPVRPTAAQREPIHTPIPDADLSSYLQTIYNGLHKEHDQIMTRVDNDNLTNIDRAKSKFFANVEHFSSQLSNEFEDIRKRSGIDNIDTALDAVAKIIRNIDAIESDPVAQRDPAVTAFNAVCATTDAALIQTRTAPTIERDNSPNPSP